MTLPALSVKKRNLELEASFKTAYSLISQAVLRMSADNADIAGTYCPQKQTAENHITSINFAEDFSKYFQTTQTYFYQTNNLISLGYTENTFKRSDAGVFNPDGHNNGAFFIKNGMLIASSGCWWSGEYGTPVDFIVDANGTKGPNRFGYDVFYFQIASGNILLPSTNKYTFRNTKSQLENCCNFTEESTCNIVIDNGTACSHFALRNEYPQDTSKKYWENLP